MKTNCDLLIVGAGPAGLSAAINAASEGLNVRLMDSGPDLGGQAVRSSLIENYAGFPQGISGADLTSAFIEQARKFNADIICPQNATGLRRHGLQRIVVADDDDETCARVVLITAGLSYRRLNAAGIGSFMGRGVLYGAPTYDPARLGACTICIVGGANSAGQAAMHMSKNPDAKVKLLIRKGIEAQMSTYLVERIRACENIEVLEGVEVIEAFGDNKLEGVTLKNAGDGSTEQMKTNHLFIFIGASPKTQWLNGSVCLDDRKFILTGAQVPGDHWKEGRQPLAFETSVPGVFAAGDVRLGSTKRIAFAAGEGAGAVSACHEYLRIVSDR